ncbi:MAG: Lrp/AsnC ligand binding domain-containing protein [Woeseiaceae bacterium]|jgi:Lrp/AsnC family leucine-responsive transcriptional regulator|nr:Lrp/AsnC ligand binding domain-containing protein [Woeseiaceae bacterium]
MTKTTEKYLNEFNQAVVRIPEVEMCHLIASSFDYLLKVRSSDIQAYRRVLADEISTLPNVASTSTFIAMESIKDTYT